LKATEELSLYPDGLQVSRIIADTELEIDPAAHAISDECLGIDNEFATLGDAKRILESPP
jgi:hypothetical protein